MVISNRKMPPRCRRIRRFCTSLNGNFKGALPLFLGLLIAFLQLTAIPVAESSPRASVTSNPPIRYTFTRRTGLLLAGETSTSRSTDSGQRRRLLDETPTTIRPLGIARVYNASNHETDERAGTASAAATAAAATATTASAESSSSAATTAPSSSSSSTKLPFVPQGIDFHWNDLDPDQMAFCAASPAHCGVMHAPVGVYLLWYGAKFTEEQKDIVRLFIASLDADASDSAATVPAWWAINTLYFDQQGRNISSNVTVKGETHDTKYTRGTMLLRSDVERLVQSAVKSGSLPYDSDGVYFVLSDEDVSQMDDPSGTGGTQYALAFCSHYCGWHSFTQGADGQSLIISFVGNAVNQCPEGCIPPYLNQPGAVAPNGDAGMDGMVSVLAHELAEATSSPFLATWFDDQGEENADICASNYGDVISDAASGVQYNVVGQNGARFLVQANLDPQAGSCMISPVAVNSPSVDNPIIGEPPPSVDVPVEEPPPPSPSFLDKLIEFITHFFGF